ncbi:MAG: immune inhibitor A, partial [Chloroflexi bacterium]|nr:immune inhibitor A [Chloroflexota bacterium]
QLNGWALLDSSTAHYGAAALFFTYLLEQTGGDPEQLAAEPKNGLAGVEAFLESTGEARAAVELVADWAVANFLDESSGPYGYRERDVSAASTAEVEAAGEGEVHQFASDYLEVSADSIAGPATFTFEGETEVAATAAVDGADGAFWYSGRGDNMDSRLTREVDLSDASSAALTFRTWYDIERWYDYAYVAVSDDGGRSWTALSGEHTTTEDPLGVSYGPGYGGSSDGWIDERIDLSAYAGERILLRFEYITDDSSNASGWAVDDIAVAEAGFFDGAASDPGGWHREGFRRVSEALPQRFELRLITLGPAPAVERIELDAANRAEVPLAGLGAGYRTAVVAIIATTDGTLEPARYRYEVAAP